jgi:Cu+-exporting ATPase
MNQTTFWIDGMTCQHCVQSVQRALSSVQGVQQAEVNLSEKKAVLRHSDVFDPARAVQAVKQAGYKAGLVS